MAEVEAGDQDPGVPGPSPLETEGAGRPVPDRVQSLSSLAEVAGASTSYQDIAGLMWATLRALTAGSFQMLGAGGIPDDLDIEVDRDADIPSGYPEDSCTFSTPDVRDIMSIFEHPSVVTSAGYGIDMDLPPTGFHFRFRFR